MISVLFSSWGVRQVSTHHWNKNPAKPTNQPTQQPANRLIYSNTLAFRVVGLEYLSLWNAYGLAHGQPLLEPLLPKQNIRKHNKPKYDFNPIIESTFLTLYGRNQMIFKNTTMCIFGCASVFFYVFTIFGFYFRFDNNEWPYDMTAVWITTLYFLSSLHTHRLIWPYLILPYLRERKGKERNGSRI